MLISGLSITTPFFYIFVDNRAFVDAFATDANRGIEPLGTSSAIPCFLLVPFQTGDGFL